MKRIEFKSFDGRTIFLTEWKKVEEVKGVLQISHGMAEHSLRYKLLAEYLANFGYVVVADDHRAHGLTDKANLGYASGDIFSDTVKDMAEITKYYKQKYNVPILLFGHSYGSFLTQAYIERFGKDIDGAIIGGSAKMDGAEVFAGLVLSKLFYGKGGEKPSKLLADITFGSYNKNFKEGTFISSLLSECERYEKDELCGFTCSYNFYMQFFKGLKTLYKKENYSKIDINKPILLLAGSLDPVGKMSNSVKKLNEFYKRIGVKDIDMHIYEGVRHEYLNDISREKAFLDIKEFLDKICVKISK